MDKIDTKTDGSATLPGHGLTEETLSAHVMKVIGDFADAKTQADQTVRLVSMTLDVTADLTEAAPLTITPDIDRKTRTIVFAGGQAEQDGRVVMNATAIYRIVST